MYYLQHELLCCIGRYKFEPKARVCISDTTWTRCFIRYANDFQPHVYLPQATVYMLLKIYDQRHKKKLKVGEGGKSMSVEGYRMVQGHPPLPNFQN